MAGVGLTAIYGGYFGAAQGVILLALIGSLYEADVQKANALKNALALVTNLVSGVLLAASGKVDWSVAFVVAVGSLVGGVLGVRLARRLPPWPSGCSRSSSRWWPQPSSPCARQPGDLVGSRARL